MHIMKCEILGLQVASLFCGLVLASAGLPGVAFAEEVSLDVSQMPYYDQANERSRANVKSYAAAKGPKALAINPNGESY